MSNPASDPNGRKRRRPDPATAPREELLRYFSVDPKVGLGGREADRRRDRSRALPLFSTTARTFPQCLLAVIREPVLWIMLAISLIALFFDRAFLGTVCLILMAAHVALCAFLLWRAERIDTAMQKAYDAPMPRVLRSGRLCRVGAEAVVPGDILYLYPGDLVPADCRLLRTDRFSVSERELDATDPARPTRHLDKDADFLPEDARSPRLSPPNMAFAGAVVESGFALAVVVAAGSRTHLGGLIGTIRPAHGTRRPESVKVTANLSSVAALILAILIIPLVVVGILTLGDRHAFFDIFLSALALATLCLCEHTTARLAFLTAAIRRDAATARDAVNTADIRSHADAERLTTVTDLLLLGTAALHDGGAHPTALYTVSEGEVMSHGCDIPAVDADASDAVELLFLWQYGRAALPTAASGQERETETALRTLVPTLCEWAGTDPEALLLKYRDICPTRGGVRATVHTPDGARQWTVSVARTLGERPAAFAMAYREARAEGLSTLFVLASDDADAPGEAVPVAMLTFAPRTCPKTAGWIKGMEAAGIRVSALLADSGEESIRTLTACGLCDRHPIDRPTDGERDLSARIDGGLRAFVGCSDREITACIHALRAKGRTVGVLSVDGRDIPHLNAADVALTCSPSFYAAAESDFMRPAESHAAATPDGVAEADHATDLCRRRADVIVRRSTEAGGGLGGVRTALATADRIKTALDATVAYLLLSTALRLLTVILTVSFGLFPVPAPLLLFSGFAVDLLVIVSLTHLPAASTLSPRRRMTDGLEKPWLTHKIRLICLSVSATLPWIVALVARLVGADIGTGISGYALLCLVAMQFALYRDVTPRRDAAGERQRDRSSVFAVLTFIMVYVGSLAVALGMGLHPLYALLVPPIPALLYIGATAVAARIRHRRT